MANRAVLQDDRSPVAQSSSLRDCLNYYWHFLHGLWRSGVLLIIIGQLICVPHVPLMRSGAVTVQA